MTREQAEKKIKELMKEEKGMFWERVQKALSSGALDLDSYEDNYLLPKIIMCAVHGEMEWQYMPLTKEGKKEAKNLKAFL